MIENRRWLPAALLLTLVTLAISRVQRRRSDVAATSAHILRRPNGACRPGTTGKAAVEYRKAAEAGDSAETARTATRLAFAYRFNDEALRAAKRWVKLDPDSDEARLYLAQIYFRLGDLGNARRQYARIIESSDDRRVTDCCRWCATCRKRASRRMPTS